MSSYEIFVTTNSKIKQVNPIPKFDLIYENLVTEKIKVSTVLSKLKGKMKSDVNMIYLPNRKFIAELNSHLVDKSFKRNNQIDASEVFCEERFYGDVYKAEL
jgi:hypothetical protein